MCGISVNQYHQCVSEQHSALTGMNSVAVFSRDVNKDWTPKEKDKSED